MILELLNNLPEQLVYTKIISLLSLNDLVRLERSTCHDQSKQLILSLIQHCPSINITNINNIQYKNNLLLWLEYTQCKIQCFPLFFPGINSVLEKKILVEQYDLSIHDHFNEINLLEIKNEHVGLKITSLHINGLQSIHIITELVSYIPTVM